MKLVKALLIGSLVFGAVSPARAEMTPSERALIAQENMIVSVYAVQLTTLLKYMAEDPDKYLVEAPKLIDSWDKLTPTLGNGQGLEYMHRAIYAHRSILRFGAIGALTPEIFDCNFK